MCFFLPKWAVTAIWESFSGGRGRGLAFWGAVAVAGVPEPGILCHFGDGGWDVVGQGQAGLGRVLDGRAAAYTSRKSFNLNLRCPGRCKEDRL